jgi:hypothetical protein
MAPQFGVACRQRRGSRGIGGPFLAGSGRVSDLWGRGLAARACGDAHGSVDVVDWLLRRRLRLRPAEQRSIPF